MRLNFIALACFFALTNACSSSQTTPALRETISLCGGTDSVTNEIREISKKSSLSFHYGTHNTEWGKQATFRLIGNGFEISIFNAFSESDYEIRALEVNSNEVDRAKMIEVYTNIKSSLKSNDNLICK